MSASFVPSIMSASSFALVTAPFNISVVVTALSAILVDVTAEFAICSSSIEPAT